jgi:hypothetical protein
MTEQELRALIRDAIAMHASAHVADPEAARTTSVRQHPSHALIPLPAGADSDDGLCIIEPAVACNHCGYCKSLGH